MYPAVFDIPRVERNSRLLLLLRPVLLLPFLPWGILYTLAMTAVHFIAWFAILFTGRHPHVLWDFLEGYFRFMATLSSYTLLLTDKYPPFVPGSAERPALRNRIDHPERVSRAGTLFRPLLLAPHFFFAVGYGAVFCVLFGITWWTVLLLGRMTDWQYRWLVSFFIYNARIRAYSLLLVDEYPPFNGAQPRAALEKFSPEFDEA